MPSIAPNRRRRRRGHLTLALAPLALLLPVGLVVRAAQAAPAPSASPAPRVDAPTAFAPDVTVIYLGSTSNWGAAGGVRAYSVGTTSCNIGNAPVAWCDSSGCAGGLQNNDHPVIAQNIYRLKDGRFSQIGMSWLKHGWLSTNSPDGACGSCVSPPGGGDQLGHSPPGGPPTGGTLRSNKRLPDGEKTSMNTWCRSPPKLDARKFRLNGWPFVE